MGEQKITQPNYVWGDGEALVEGGGFTLLWFQGEQFQRCSVLPKFSLFPVGFLERARKAAGERCKHMFHQ